MGHVDLAYLVFSWLAFCGVSVVSLILAVISVVVSLSLWVWFCSGIWPFCLVCAVAECFAFSVCFVSDNLYVCLRVALLLIVCVTVFGLHCVFQVVIRVDLMRLCWPVLALLVLLQCCGSLFSCRLMCMDFGCSRDFHLYLFLGIAE